MRARLALANPGLDEHLSVSCLWIGSCGPDATDRESGASRDPFHEWRMGTPDSPSCLAAIGRPYGMRAGNTLGDTVAPWPAAWYLQLGTASRAGALPCTLPRPTPSRNRHHFPIRTTPA